MKTATAKSSREVTRAGSRDRELVRFVGRHGVVTIEHIMFAMRVGRTATYRRVRYCVEAGLLERLEILRSEPNVLRATREGLRYAGLSFPIAAVSPGEIEHALRCVGAALPLVREVGDDAVLTEREIAEQEARENRPIASAKIGILPNGSPRLHRADLAVRLDEGLAAIEIELSPKAPRRLEKIISGWSLATCVVEVAYFCRPGKTYRAVSRAVAKVHAAPKVTVHEGVRE
jgi:hypothetical protein